mmetsp:Transcript_5606/g.17634  ORF Transcript_5606/g.17634 Transcript_5606/m.17634 type:complete len:215 (+) Transcript_5606:316-960(+)
MAWPSGTMNCSHLATRRRSRWASGRPATSAIRLSIPGKSSSRLGSAGSRRSPAAPATALKAAASSGNRSPGTIATRGSKQTLKERSCPGSRGLPASCSSSTGSTVARASPSAPSPSPPKSSNCLRGLSLKKQLTPYFRPHRGGRPWWRVRGSSTPGLRTLDHMTAQPFRGTIWMPISGKSVSPPASSGKSLRYMKTVLGLKRPSWCLLNSCPAE